MEEKVFELEKRLEKLERIEKRRKTILWIKIVGVLLLISSIFIFGYIVHRKVEKALKPYKVIIEKTNNVNDKIENKIEKIKDIIK